MFEICCSNGRFFSGQRTGDHHWCCAWCGDTCFSCMCHLRKVLVVQALLDPKKCASKGHHILTRRINGWAATESWRVAELQNPEHSCGQVGCGISPLDGTTFDQVRLTLTLKLQFIAVSLLCLDLAYTANHLFIIWNPEEQPRRWSLSSISRP